MLWSTLLHPRVRVYAAGVGRYREVQTTRMGQVAELVQSRFSNVRAISQGVDVNIPSLDGLRALSFSIVFASHAGFQQVPGGFGVTVFFFLSGYLITTLMRIEADRLGRVRLKQFYLRRALRILPPFYLVLVGATCLGLTGLLPGDPRPQFWPVASQVLHWSNYWMATHDWRGIATGTGVYWSLAVEEHFYLLFPAVFLLLKRLGRTGWQMAVCFWGASAIVLAWRCVLVFLLHARVDRTNLCSDTRIDSILFGCALAVWSNPVLDKDSKLGRSPLSRYALLAVGAVLLMVGFVVRGTAFRETVRYTLQGIGLTPIFLVAVGWPRLILLRPLNWRPVKFIGRLSYSLYLVHYSVLVIVANLVRWPGRTPGLLALLMSFAIAWLIYIGVEKPCARIRRRLSASVVSPV